MHARRALLYWRQAMTVSTVVDHNDYTGNGVTTSFPYTFRIFKKSDLTVSVIDLSENITVLALDTDYTVTNAGGYSGGNVVLTTPLATGWKISIARDLEPTQETDLRNQGKFFAEVHEDAFDKLTMLIQQVGSMFRLALRKPSSIANWYDALGNYIRNLHDPRDPQDAATKNYVDVSLGKTLRVPEPIPALPSAAARANKMPAFDSAGNPIVVLPPSGSASEVLLELASAEDGKGDALIAVKQPYTGSVARTQHQKNAEFISVTDFGAVPGTDCSAAFNAAIQAAKKSSESSQRVLIPASSQKYFIKDVILDSAIEIFGEGKISTMLSPVSDGDTCFIVNHEFCKLSDFTIQSISSPSLSTGIKIKAGLVTVENCSFAFLRYCIDSPSGFGAGELDFRFNRFAASTYGVVLGGGQINTRFNQNTFNGCKCGLFVTENSSQVTTNIEGIELLGDRFYACGDTTLDTAAIEIVNCRWVWLTDVMSDLATGIALRATNTQYLQLTNGYYSSNRSGNKSCVAIHGSCNEFMAKGVKFSDSRNFGLEIMKVAGLVPSRAKLVDCLFQYNDINAAQQGDLIVDSVVGVTAEGCTFLANKPMGIALIDNQTGGTSVTTRNCYFYGQVFVGVASCKFYHFDSPTHPDKQVGVVTIPNGVASATAAVGIVSLVPGRGIAVTATSASQLAAVAAGVSGSNYQFTRSGTTGDAVISYSATLIQS